MSSENLIGGHQSFCGLFNKHSQVCTCSQTNTTGNNSDPNDKVNHPLHYNNHPSGVECITVVEHMGFNVGNAIKYLWRADEKGNTLEDLKKAEFYVKREIARRTAQGRGDLAENSSNSSANS